MTRQVFYRVTIILSIIFILVSCDPFTTAPTEPPIAPINTPAPSLEIYQSPYLNPLDTPNAYHARCTYLANRWNSMNAGPGTVVMIVTFNDESLYDFTQIMTQIYEQGFKAISMQQLFTFMNRNGKIPSRSVVLIQENNQSADDFYRKYRKYWESWGWVVVNGWVSDPNTPEFLWEENVAMEYEGWVDHQSQGVISDTILTNESSKVVISRELKGPIDSFAEHYAKNPLAIIWPNGGFGQRPIQAARQLGYKLGFTTNARGPVMYNWVPLADDFDPQRPTYIPEAGLGDPLMTLPRYPASEVLEALDDVRRIGNESAEFARDNREVEFKYYETVCEPIYGPIPTP